MLVTNSTCLDKWVNYYYFKKPAELQENVAHYAEITDQQRTSRAKDTTTTARNIQNDANTKYVKKKQDEPPDRRMVDVRLLALPSTLNHVFNPRVFGQLTWTRFELRRIPYTYSRPPFVWLYSSSHFYFSIFYIRNATLPVSTFFFYNVVFAQDISIIDWPSCSIVFITGNLYEHIITWTREQTQLLRDQPLLCDARNWIGSIRNGHWWTVYILSLWWLSFSIWPFFKSLARRKSRLFLCFSERERSIFYLCAIFFIFTPVVVVSEVPLRAGT